MEWSQFYIKVLGVNCSNWDKSSEGITKNIHIWNRVRLFLRGKKIIQLVSLNTKWIQDY